MHQTPNVKRREKISFLDNPIEVSFQTFFLCKTWLKLEQVELPSLKEKGFFTFFFN